MFKFIGTCASAILITISLSAQTPAYYNSTFPSPAQKASFKCNPPCSNGYKWQSIILSSDITGAPAGAVQNIYLRLDTTDANAVFPELKVKLGYTKKFGHPLLPNVTDTFITNLTTVVDVPSYTFSGANAVGAWVKFPLSPGSFNYRTDSNLVLEVSRGAQNVNLSLLATAGNSPSYVKTIGGDRAATSIFVGSPPQGVIAEELDFGLDLVPTGLNTLGNIAAVGLFPNPATAGHFMFSLETKQPVRELEITLTNAIGQTILRQRQIQPGRSFFLKLSSEGLPAGAYWLHATADGERIVRQLTIE